MWVDFCLNSLQCAHGLHSAIPILSLESWILHVPLLLPLEKLISRLTTGLLDLFLGQLSFHTLLAFSYSSTIFLHRLIFKLFIFGLHLVSSLLPLILLFLQLCQFLLSLHLSSFLKHGLLFLHSFDSRLYSALSSSENLTWAFLRAQEPRNLVSLFFDIKRVDGTGATWGKGLRCICWNHTGVPWCQ